jgi:hypothetical protein
MEMEIDAVRREGVGRFTCLLLRIDWGGKEGYLPLILPLLLRLAFVFPSIVLGTKDFVHCAYCVGEACCIITLSNGRR